MTELQNSAFKMKMAPVPFVGDILPKAGAMVVSEHDGHIYYADRLGWHKADAEYSPLTFFIDFDGVTQPYFNFRLPVGSSLLVDNGDGTTAVLNGADASNVIYTNVYTEAGKYTMVFTGDIYTLTHLQILRDNAFGSVTGWGELVGLKTMTITSIEKLYGNCEPWASLPLIEAITIQPGAMFTGDVSAFGKATSLTALRIESTNLTFDQSADPWTFDGFSTLKIGGLSGGDVGNALKALQSCTSCVIDLTSSGPRSSNSDASVLSAIGNGNILFVLEGSNNMELGPELHVDANAASDPNGNEADAVTGWTPTNLDAPNEFISQRNKRFKGDFCIKANSNPSPSAGAGFTKAFTVEDTEPYRGSFAISHIGTGGSWRVVMDGVTGLLVDSGSVSSYVQLAYYITAAGLTHDLTVDEGSSASSGGVYFDNMSLKKVTLP